MLEACQLKFPYSTGFRLRSKIEELFTEELESGEPPYFGGTHALLEDKVSSKTLGCVSLTNNIDLE